MLQIIMVLIISYYDLNTEIYMVYCHTSFKIEQKLLQLECNYNKNILYETMHLQNSN